MSDHPEKSPQEIFIERCPHDSENPYAQISRHLIRDQSISPECRWLLIYLLSMDRGWKISVKQIWAHTKGFIGLKKLYKIIKEACEAGYMKSEIKFKGNLKQGVKYYLSETPKFKDSNNFSDAAVSGAPKLDAPKSAEHKKELSKEENKKKSPPPLPPPKDASKENLTEEEEDFLLKKEMQRKSDEPIKCRSKWRKAVLKDFREKRSDEEKASKLLLERVLSHRAEAEKHDLKTFKGFKVYACDDRVEFCYPTGRQIVVPYSVSEEEWKNKVVW